MAGGKGTRIASVAADIPKPMISICGKPVLEHEIENLKNQGFDDIIITVGYLGNIIKNHFGDGKKFGVNIEYYHEETPLGNAGALVKIRNKLKDDFLLLNGDVIFDIDFNRFVAYHKKKGGLVTMFTHPNSHPYDSGLVIVGENGRVDRWLTKEDDRPVFYANRVNAGLHVLSPALVNLLPSAPSIDLDRQILQPLTGTGKMFAYDSPEYVKDMDTPDGYAEVLKDFRSGFMAKRNLRNKQKAIFLDRDGTINEFAGFLRSPSQFKLLQGAAEAIKKINDSEYLAIVATNQPVVARGEATYATLREIHNKMETLLGEGGAFVDGIYFCPHHPDKGIAGEVPELKINCDCRKPKAGMLLKAAEDLNIDLSKSWMIGDGETDVACGKNAGCRTARVVGGPLDKNTFLGGNFKPDIEGKSLLECINKIFEAENNA